MLQVITQIIAGFVAVMKLAMAAEARWNPAAGELVFTVGWILAAALIGIRGLVSTSMEGENDE